MATLIYLANWRVAAFGASALVALVLFFTWLGRDLLAGKNNAVAQTANADTGASSQTDLSQQTVGQTLATLLVQPALWGAFLFFAFPSMALSAVQNYNIPMLGEDRKSTRLNSSH